MPICHTASALGSGQSRRQRSAGTSPSHTAASELIENGVAPSVVHGAAAARTLSRPWKRFCSLMSPVATSLGILALGPATHNILFPRAPDPCTVRTEGTTRSAPRKFSSQITARRPRYRTAVTVYANVHLIREVHARP